jgi:putative protein kinase ArgK-like GTPase of G3E family
MSGEGIETLVDRLERHADFLSTSGEGRARRSAVVRAGLLRIITDEIAASIVGGEAVLLEELVVQCAERKTDVYTAAARLRAQWVAGEVSRRGEEVRGGSKVVPGAVGRCWRHGT